MTTPKRKTERKTASSQSFYLEDKCPVDKLHYKLTASLVHSIALAHRNAGEVSAMRFSYYGLKRLQGNANKTRIEYFVCPPETT